jgi:hypothetical protein
MSRISTKFLQDSAVTNAKLANMADNRIKGNISGGAAAPSDLTGTQVTGILVNFVGDSGSGGTKGLVPAPASGDAAALKFLKADGTWSAVPGGASAGDISETSFSASNNVASPANVTGLAFANGSIRSFEALLSISVDATSDLFESVKLHGVQRGAAWSMSQTAVGDDSGFIFSITTGGQVQYTNNSYSGFSTAVIKFRAITTAV